MPVKTAILIFVGCILSSCVVPRADISPEGYLEIFGPSSLITKNHLPQIWFIDGTEESNFTQNYLNIERIDGSPALTLSAGNRSYVFAKRTKANLLATPFFSWSWNVPAFQGKEYPGRLIIGFHGGDPKSGSWGSQPLVYTGQTTPPYDRVLTIIWHQNALRRGTIDRSAKLPKYIARGGIDNTNIWQTENIDLAALYKQIWPKDEFRKVQIMFVGFAAMKSNQQTSAAFADVVLAK